MLRVNKLVHRDFNCWKIPTHLFTSLSGKLCVYPVCVMGFTLHITSVKGIHSVSGGVGCTNENDGLEDGGM